MEAIVNDVAIGAFAPEFTPDEAIRAEPLALAQLKERASDRERAAAARAERQAVVEDNEETIRWLRTKQREFTVGLRDVLSDSRAELFQTRAACDVEALSSRIRAKQEAVAFIDDAYSEFVEVQYVIDQIALQDATANELRAEQSAMEAAALASRIRTVARLGPVLESEGEIGVIGRATVEFQRAADNARVRAEAAEQQAREARLAFERAQNQRASRIIAGGK